MEKKCHTLDSYTPTRCQSTPIGTGLSSPKGYRTADCCYEELCRKMKKLLGGRQSTTTYRKPEIYQSIHRFGF